MASSSRFSKKFGSGISFLFTRIAHRQLSGGVNVFLGANFPPQLPS
jgi:hypothetical protein